MPTAAAITYKLIALLTLFKHTHAHSSVFDAQLLAAADGFNVALHRLAQANFLSKCRWWAQTWLPMCYTCCLLFMHAYTFSSSVFNLLLITQSLPLFFLFFLKKPNFIIIPLLAPLFPLMCHGDVQRRQSIKQAIMSPKRFFFHSASSLLSNLPEAICCISQMSSTNAIVKTALSLLYE